MPSSLLAYQICTRCVMDTTDPLITFGERGYCNHCTQVENEILHKKWFPETGEAKLQTLIKKIKKEGEGKPYDCIIGLSGGVDSSYLAYLVVKKFGLRPLAIHVDAGWNSEIAVSNIENIVRKLDIDLYTEVIDWEEVQDLQRAYIRAGVANQDVPQDHAFFAILYQTAREYDVKYFLTGGNYATESILPSSWSYDAMDSVNLKAIYSAFGEGRLKKYPLLSFYEYYIYYPFIFNLKRLRLLDYMVYKREEAMAFLIRELGWKNYGDKHHESRWTKWFQSYYLPKRFGYDKRKAHLSSMIMSGEITREEALERLKPSPYNENERRIDEEFIIKKLQMTSKEFYDCFKAHPRQYADFPNYEKLVQWREIIKKSVFFLFGKKFMR